MMTQQQKEKQSSVQRKAMPKKNTLPQFADRIGMRNEQPRYYNAGPDSSIYDHTSCRTSTSAYPQVPEYTVDTVPLHSGRNYNASTQKTIQRVVKIQETQLTALPMDIQPYIVQYIRENNFDALNNKKMINKIKNHIQNMIKEKTPYPSFKDYADLIAFVITNKPGFASGSDSTDTQFIGDRFGKLYNQICGDINEILLMTPSNFEKYMLDWLDYPVWSIRDVIPSEPSKDDISCIVRNYRSSESSIAGNITYEYRYGPFRFFIEIHPKGGIHYGAYFLMEYSHGRKEAVKFVQSKTFTYLPLDEKGREIKYMREDISAGLMSGIKRIGHSPRQEGPDTSSDVLNIPIAQIFKKKGMVAAGIWSEQTRASVEEQRDAIRRVRIGKLASLPVNARILHIQYELLSIEKQLLSLEIELIKTSSPTPERTASIGNALERVQTSLDDLEALIHDL